MTDINTEWKNSVYLCVECKNDYKMLFQCKRYNSFDEADKGFKNNFDEPKYYDDYLSTMIPISKYTPEYFHKYIINLELSKMFFGSFIVKELIKENNGKN